MMLRTLKVFIFLSLAFLSGCATLPQQSAAPTQTLTWQQRLTTLTQLQSWDLRAIMAMHTPSESGTANLKWQQQTQNYNLLFYGPLGAGAVTIIGHPGQVSLESADGKKITATSPEKLLVQQTGWQLPVSNLFYWIRGIPAQGSVTNLQFDASHRLIHLAQAGWSIDYLAYTSINKIDLPTKLTLEKSPIKIKIVIKQWDF